jgi:hypothetical protein
MPASLYIDIVVPVSRYLSNKSMQLLVVSAAAILRRLTQRTLGKINAYARIRNRAGVAASRAAT